MGFAARRPPLVRGCRPPMRIIIYVLLVLGSAAPAIAHDFWLQPRRFWTNVRTSVPIAILRRVVDVVPYGDFVPIPFHFTIDSSGSHLGDFNRRFGVRDTYDLDLSGDTGRSIDRRLAIALGIALDALQSR